jgi:hypothetical protein
VSRSKDLQVTFENMIRIMFYAFLSHLPAGYEWGTLHFQKSNHMSTTVLNHTERNYKHSGFTIPALTRFMNWSRNQEDNRIMWVGIALVLHGCVLTPLTVMAVAFTGMNLILFMAAIIAIGMALVTNLAAMSTKVTVPVFFLSVVIDLVIVIASLFV